MEQIWYFGNEMFILWLWADEVTEMWFNGSEKKVSPILYSENHDCDLFTNCCVCGVYTCICTQLYPLILTYTDIPSQAPFTVSGGLHHSTYMSKHWWI